MNELVEKELANFIIDSDILSNDDILSSFEYSLRINPNLEDEINSVYKRIFLNIGKTEVSIFNFKYLTMFESLAKKNEGNENTNLEKLSKSMIKYMGAYFRELDVYLNIENKKELDDLNYILKLSSFVLDDAIEEEDVELAFEPFFQLESRIKHSLLYKKIGHGKKYKVESFSDDTDYNYECDNFKGGVISGI